MVITFHMAGNPLRGFFCIEREQMTVTNKSENVPPFYNTPNSRRKLGGAAVVLGEAPEPFRKVPAVPEILPICCRLRRAINHILFSAIMLLCCQYYY